MYSGVHLEWNGHGTMRDNKTLPLLIHSFRLLKSFINQIVVARRLTKRHLEFFNTTPHLSALVLGIVTSMEEKNAEQEDFDVDTN